MHGAQKLHNVPQTQGGVLFHIELQPEISGIA